MSVSLVPLLMVVGGWCVGFGLVERKGGKETAGPVEMMMRRSMTMMMMRRIMLTRMRMMMMMMLMMLMVFAIQDQWKSK